MTRLLESPEADNGGWGRRFQPIPFADFITEVVDLYKPPLRTKGTCARMRGTLQFVATLLAPDATTADITPNLVARLIVARPADQSPYTTHAYMACLRAACSYGQSQGYLRGNPFAFRNRWMRLGKPARKRHHSAAAIGSVLALLRKECEDATPGTWPHWRAWRLFAIASIAVYTGARKQEVMKLRREDLDLERRMIWIRSRRGALLKTENSEQPVPMPDVLAAVLAQWLETLDTPLVPERDRDWQLPNCQGKEGLQWVYDPRVFESKEVDLGWIFPNKMRTAPWTGGSPGYRPLEKLVAAGERAGVENFTFLSLRHSWASHAESWGFGETMIQRVLRHTNTRTQQGYRHADLDNLRRAVKDLDFNKPRDGQADAGRLDS
jgi:integrase